MEMDLVVHCGSSTLGEYINTLSTTEVSSVWREGEAIMGKCQEFTFWTFKEVGKRTPFEWKVLDMDNGSGFVNDILYKYCQRERLIVILCLRDRHRDSKQERAQEES